METDEVTDADGSDDTTDSEVGGNAEETEAVGETGLVLAAWWQAALWLFLLISAGPR